MKSTTALEGVKMAMQTEMNGIEFYRMAAERTTDPRGKEAFQQLAADETLHFNALFKHYQSMLKDQGWDPSVTLPDTAPLTGVSPIFSEEFRSRLGDRHFEMSALSIGVLLESDSVDFYRRMKETSSDVEARRLFTILQQWEEKHLDALNHQLQLLKEDYWAQAHFEPLY